MVVGRSPSPAPDTFPGTHHIAREDPNSKILTVVPIHTDTSPGTHHIAREDPNGKIITVVPNGWLVMVLL